MRVTIDDDGTVTVAPVTKTGPGLNGEGALSKAAETDLTADFAGVAVVKMSPEKRFTLGVAYPANKPDVSRAADGFKDFAGPAAVEKAAWDWMTKSRDIGLWHRDGTSGHGTVVESYIYRGPDWTVEAADGSTQLVKAGDWMLGVQWDDTGWSIIKSGAANGFSPQGTGQRGTPTAEQLMKLRS